MIFSPNLLGALGFAGTFSLAIFFCPPAQAQSRLRPVAAYDSLWRAIDQYYPYFRERHINRDSLYRVYRPRVRPRMSKRKLARVLGEVVTAFGDSHTRLLTPYGAYGGRRHTGRITTVDAASNRLERILLDNDRLRYAVLDSGRLAYIRMRTAWGDEADFPQLSGLADSIAGKRGLIIDLRRNLGGNERLAYTFVGRLVRDTTLYRYTRHRAPTPFYSLTDWRPSYVWPRQPVHFSGKIAVLTDRTTGSAAESFVLMLRALPRTRQFGDRTCGCSGQSRPVVLAPRWLFLVATRQLADPDCRLVEGHGIEPDERIQPSVEAAARGQDPVLDRAIRWMMEH